MKRRDREEPTYTDPVCGMAVSLKTAAEAAAYKGKTFYFCADVCRKQFEADPEKYVRGRERR